MTASDDEELNELYDTEERIIDPGFDRVFFGPHCKEGCGTRTTNPSKICRKCLGSRACAWCRGTGMRASGGACLHCPGTGLKGNDDTTDDES